MAKLSVGDQIPSLELPRDGGETFKAEQYEGKPLVLFFYPKDSTPGCTKEAIGFTEQLEAFEQLGVQVVGMSPDPVKSHDKFIAKHELKVPLLSDEDKSTLEAFGVWVEKSMYGKKYMGVERTTYLIDETGKILHEWNKVKVPGHVEEVLAVAKEHFS